MPDSDASITAGNQWARALPEVHTSATGRADACASPNAKKAALRSSRMGVQLDEGLPLGRQHQRGRARAGREHDPTHTAAHQAIEERQRPAQIPTALIGRRCVAHANCSAVDMAASLCSVSCHSESGSEPATIPAPA